MELKKTSSWAHALGAAGPDLVGLGGLAAIVAGVYLLAGTGWALVTVGVPLFAGYVWRLQRAARRG